MPLYVGDYLKDTAHLTAAEHGAYLLLIMQAWSHGGAIPTDLERLRLICRFDREEWEACRGAVLPFFYVQDGCYRHKRIDIELKKASANSIAKADAGKKGAEKRWQKDSKKMAEPLAVPSVRQWQNDAPSPSPSPIKKDSDLRSVVRPASDEPEFEQFWMLYPRKDAKLDARKAWNTARKMASAADIIGGLKAYPFSGDAQYQKLPAGWLRDGRWQRAENTAPQTVAVVTSRNNSATDLAIDLGMDLLTPVEEQFHAEERPNGRKATPANGHALGYEAGPPDGRWEDAAYEAANWPVRDDAGR